MKTSNQSVRGGALSLLALAACAETPVVDHEELAVFAVLPEVIIHPETGAPHPELVRLGEQLFRDSRLSIDDSVSCNTCHDLDHHGVDGERYSEGVGGQRGGRNAPTVFHAAGHVAQFWDGRAVDVEEQAKGPILNPVEMGMPDGAAVVAKLAAIPEYRDAFAAAFPGEAEPLTFDNLGRAIGAFERGLVVPTRWDAFLAGEDEALSDDELVGLDLFLAVGCVDCHDGAYLGGTSFHKLGRAVTWPSLADEGRKVVTGDDADAFVFKTPSLRLVEHTGPYLHDGSFDQLDGVVRAMARHQLDRSLSDEEVARIVDFLQAL